MSRRPRPQNPSHHRWMVSYLDVLTILLIFFLTAAAKNWKSLSVHAQASNAPAPHAENQNGSTSAASPAVALLRLASALPTSLARSSAGPASAAAVLAFRPPIPLFPLNLPLEADAHAPDSSANLQRGPGTQASGSDVSDPALAATEQKLREAGLDVRALSDSNNDSDHPGQQGLTINLSQTVLFSPGDDRIRPAASRSLQKIADALRDIPNKVNLAGHADATPIHNRRFRNNWELAAARSLRLMEALTIRYGIDESRVSISSYGSIDPKSPNNTAGGRASNRRVEIFILSERTR